MALVLMVEMGMGMVLVREIEMKDDCHVQYEAWTRHMRCSRPQGSPMELAPFHLHVFFDYNQAFLTLLTPPVLKQSYFGSTTSIITQTTLTTHNLIQTTASHTAPQAKATTP